MRRACAVRCVLPRRPSGVCACVRALSFLCSRGQALTTPYAFNAPTPAAADDAHPLHHHHPRLDLSTEKDNELSYTRQTRSHRYGVPSNTTHTRQWGGGKCRWSTQTHERRRSRPFRVASPLRSLRSRSASPVPMEVPQLTPSTRVGAAAKKGVKAAERHTRTQHNTTQHTRISIASSQKRWRLDLR